jgi:hypothetical protein
MTLVELLAVVAILGLAMGVTVGVAGPMSGASSERAAVASLIALLDNARATALARGECAVVADPEGRTLSLRRPAADGDLMTVDTAIAPHWSIAMFQIEPGDRPLQALDFDHRGCCRDALVELHGPRGAIVRFELLGAVGQLNRLEAQP